MTQTLAVFYEAYRNLNSKKLFWAVLAISGLAVAAFACVGVNEDGFKILVWQFDNEQLNSQFLPPATLYKWLFVQIGIGFWLSWLGAILALISTAGIFPDLLTAGSIDLFVSKPISRLRLFVTEYVAGLLFVALQVTIFSLASFLVIGLRGGVWEPGLFVAIPVAVCFFSYLFAVCVLLGVLTRSTVAALLLTLLFWFFVYAVGAAENSVLMFKTMQEHRVSFAPQPDEAAPQEATEDASSALDTAHTILYDVKTFLPKTTETILLLERLLIDMAELPQQAAQPGRPNPRQQEMQAAQQEFAETLRSRSIAWVVGTSLGFEVCVLACAALLFCRRDY